MFHMSLADISYPVTKRTATASVLGIGILAAASVATGYINTDPWVSHIGAFVLGVWFAITVLAFYHA